MTKCLYSNRLSPTILLFSIISLFIVSCNKTNTEADNTPAIATVGNRHITWNHIWRSYHTEPKWDRGITQKEAFTNQVEFLIDEKLFAQAAESAGVREIPRIENYLSFIKEKEMIKELYRQNVEAKVNISEEQLRTAYHRSKKQVTFQFFLSESLDNAQQYLRKLKNSNFDGISLLNTKTDEKGVSADFTFGDMDEKVEAVVFDLKANETAGPISVDGRWLVLKLIDGKSNKFLSENDFNANRTKLKKTLFNREKRKLSDKYVYELLKDEDIVINPEAFYSLAAEFEAIVKNKETDLPFPVYLADNELKQVRRNVTANWEKTLVTFGNKEMKVAEFLEKMFNMPTGMRPQVNFKPLLKKAIATTVRNEFLLEKAYKANLDKSQRVLADAGAEMDAVLAHTWLKSILKNITCSDEEITALKNHENFSELNARFNNNLTDDHIRDIIIDKKFILRKIELSDSLRLVYNIEVDSTAFLANIDEPDEEITNKPIAFSYREKFQ